MRRREFIGLLGGAAVAWPPIGRAQQPSPVARIGMFGVDRANPVPAKIYEALFEELQRYGFTEGTNLTVEFRSVEVDLSEPFSAAARDLVRSKVDLLLPTGPEQALQAAWAASRTIPIVMIAINYDPIARGYVRSLAHPGGNITGVFYRQPELAEKQVELLTQAFPEKKRMGVLWDDVSGDQFRAAEQRAQSLSVELYPLKLENPPYDFGSAFAALAQKASQMVLILSVPEFTPHRFNIAELALQHRLPTMFTFRTYVEAGGLMYYGVDNRKMGRKVASYVAKVLNGTKPSDLPIEQPTEYELIVNLKTAKAIGIEVPPAILLRADEVIE
jgi:putative ABC transport system substrate-binding protein